MTKFHLSTDSCVDQFGSYLHSRNVSYIILKRIIDGAAIEEMYDSAEEYERFYDSLRQGALPTTSQLNEFELVEYFQSLLAQCSGDIVHLALSSGLSGTCANAESAARVLNEQISGRQIFVVDSLSASRGMAMLLDNLIWMRDNGSTAEQAVREICHIRDHQQIWAIIGDLRHLKRGGRISGFRAAVGSLLGIKPILNVNAQGRLDIERTVKGTRKAIDYLLSRMESCGFEAGADPMRSRVYLMHSSCAEQQDLLAQAICQRFGDIDIDRGMIGPIIGTHVGDGTFGVIFAGAQRLGER